MKGFTNNPNGRPKGVPNKITTDLRAMIGDFLDNEWEAVQQDYKLLEPKERLIYYEKLLQYCVPKNNKVGIESGEEKIEQALFQTVLSYELDLEKIPYADLKQMIEESEAFMSKKEGTLTRIELPDNKRKYENK